MADTDPAFRAEDSVPEQPHRQQCQQASAPGPGNVIDELVVVDLGEEEHGRQAGGDVVDLLGMKADILGVQRGRVNLKNRNRTQHQHQAEQHPVEIAIAEEAAHRHYCPLPAEVVAIALLLLGAGAVLGA